MSEITAVNGTANAWLGIEVRAGKNTDHQYLRVAWRDVTTHDVAGKRKQRHKIVGNITKPDLSTPGFNTAFLEVFNAAFLAGAEPKSCVCLDTVRVAAEIARARTAVEADPSNTGQLTAALTRASEIVAGLIATGEKRRATEAAAEAAKAAARAATQAA